MNIDVAKDIAASLLLLRAVTRVELLDKGFSPDKKYVLWEGDAPKFLLRLSDIKLQERRVADFEMMVKHYERGVKCPKPYTLGIAGSREVCYQILSYIPGESADEALPKLTEAAQTELGFRAGLELRKLHSLHHSDPSYDWPTRRVAKYKRYAERGSEAGLYFDGQEEVGHYVEANLRLMDDAPVRFQHDDYYPGNLIVDDAKFAGVIDFTNFDWGDPVEDFYKLVWFSVPVSAAFASGQVQGYLSDGGVVDFWRRYNLYVAMSLYSSLVWVHEYRPEDTERFRGLIEDILSTHDFESSEPPRWYRE